MMSWWSGPPPFDPLHSVPIAMMRLGGVVTVTWLGIYIWRTVSAERRHRKAMAPFRTDEFLAEREPRIE